MSYNSRVIVLVISTWRLADLKSLARLLPDLHSTQSYYHYSDEGLTLETSVFESFTVANLPYRPCG